MITLEMVEDLSLWVLNYGKEFEEVFKRDEFLQMTEAGLRQLERQLCSIFDSDYTLSIQTIEEILIKMLNSSEADTLFQTTNSIQMRSFSDLMLLAVQNTFKTYTSEGEFFEFVQLEPQDFEQVVQTQIPHDTLSWNLQFFEFNFDDIQNELAKVIESKGYEFVEDDYGVSQYILPKTA